MAKMNAALFVALTAAVGAGCGDDRIVLTAVPAGAEADGLTVVEVSARVTSIGEDADDGTEVSFRASEPLLFATPEAAEPAAPGGLVSGAREMFATVRAGRARVYLRAPVEATTVLVDARFSSVDDTEIGGEVAVKFREPPLVSAGRNVDAAPTEVEPLFSFGCAADNIGAFVPDRDAIVVPCTVVTRDHGGRAVPHVPLAVYAEAGELAVIPPAADRARSVHYVVPALPVRLPADVAPLPEEEPFAVEGAGLLDGAVEQNPRDGLVTLLAVVRGHEAYADLDGDGIRDDGEPYIDEGEPFLDVDDDGVHDPAIDGPHCCDSNGNGQVDGPNGRWDRDVWIGRATHILWSGPVSEAAGRSEVVVEPEPIPAGESGAAAIAIVDANYNPIAMRGSGDGPSLQPVGEVVLFPPPDIEVLGGPGIDLVDRFPFFVFGGGAPTEGVLVYEGVRTWSATVEDARNDDCAEGDWALQVRILHTPADNAAARSATLVAEGTLAPAASPPCP